MKTVIVYAGIEIDEDEIPGGETSQEGKVRALPKTHQ